MSKFVQGLPAAPGFYWFLANVHGVDAPAIGTKPTTCKVDSVVHLHEGWRRLQGYNPMPYLGAKPTVFSVDDPFILEGWFAEIPMP